MGYLYFSLGLIVGTIFGIGLTLFYMQWRMKKQLGNMQNQFSDLMGATDELVNEFENLEENEQEKSKEE